MKLDNYKQFISGNYSWNTCVVSDQGQSIFRSFERKCDKLHRNNQLVDNFYYIKKDFGDMKYIIHVFKTKYKRLARDKVGVNCGVLINFKSNVSFVRIFSIPCK